MLVNIPYMDPMGYKVKWKLDVVFLHRWLLHHQVGAVTAAYFTQPSVQVKVDIAQLLWTLSQSSHLRSFAFSFPGCLEASQSHSQMSQSWSGGFWITIRVSWPLKNAENDEEWGLPCGNMREPRIWKIHCRSCSERSNRWVLHIHVTLPRVPTAEGGPSVTWKKSLIFVCEHRPKRRGNFDWFL